MTIQAAQTAASTCLPGCAGHLGGAVHISVEQVVKATAYASEHTQIYVSRELDDRLGVAAVRIQGAGDAPLRPAEALQLATAIAAEAMSALAWQVTR
jgi:hypothetical protein